VSCILTQMPRSGPSCTMCRPQLQNLAQLFDVLTGGRKCPSCSVPITIWWYTTSWWQSHGQPRPLPLGDQERERRLAERAGAGTGTVASVGGRRRRRRAWARDPRRRRGTGRRDAEGTRRTPLHRRVRSRCVGAWGFQRGASPLAYCQSRRLWLVG